MSSNTLSNVYLYCFMDSRQENLIYHFIRYYKAMGIPIKNWKVVLHLKNDCENSVKLLEDNGINYEVVDEYITDLKRDKANEFIQTIDNGWLVYPDLDEFFDYGQDLPSMVKHCEDNHIELVKGREVERFCKDYELAPITKEQDMFELFSVGIDYGNIKHEIDQENINVMLVKITPDKKPKYVNSHRLENEETYKRLGRDLTLHHFRWSLYAVDCIRYKLLRYMIEKTGYQSMYYKTLFFMIKKRNNKYYIDIESQLV
jgi:hypothetical protein